MDTLSCLICSGSDADDELGRVQVWENRLWRLTTSLVAPVPGFSYLEPKRHIPDISQLDGREADGLGHVLTKAVRALKDETGADLVYVSIFGERLAHLHVNLAPHQDGDVLADGQALIKPGAELLPREELQEVADRIAKRLSA